jgi:uncharacterized protein YjbI with pentapeptide repeats
MSDTSIRLLARLGRRFRKVSTSKQTLGQSQDKTRQEAEKRADDLGAIQKVVEDASSVIGGIWLSYVFVLFYLSVAVAAVTHADLLLENPVKLPFLNIELPLVFFFLLSPVLFLIVHAYTLIHLVFLGRKAERFHEALYINFPDKTPALKSGPADAHNTSIREGLRSQLPSNIFVQILAGPLNVRTKNFGRLLRLVSSFTLVVGPLLTLLLFQISFLPYHDGFVTGAHRFVIVADAILILWLWPKIVGGGQTRAARSFVRLPTLSTTILAALAVFFSFGIATFPGEIIEQYVPEAAVVPTTWTPPSLSQMKSLREIIDWANTLEFKSPHELLFSGAVNQTTRRRTSLFSNTLVLPGFDIYEALKIDDPSKVQWKDTVLSLRGRHLEGAVLNDARLYKVDFTDAHMEQASLSGAQLPGATLFKANLQGAVLSVAHLEGANLDSAHLESAVLVHTSLEGASLYGAQMQATVLLETHLQGANLRRAELQAAVTQIDQSNLIAGPDFSAALLGEAQLQGAQFINTNFTAAELAGARAWRTIFDQSKSPDANCQNLDLRPIIAGDDDKNVVWDQNVYSKFVTNIAARITNAKVGDQVTNALEILDCEKSEANKSEKLACASSGKVPASIEQIQRDFRKECKTNMTRYKRAAFEQLKRISCNGREQAIFVFRGLLGSPLVSGEMFEKPSLEAAELMEYVASKRCALNTSLTDRDKSDMQFIISRARGRD